MAAHADQRAQALLRSACSSDPREARALLAADAALARHDLATACASGEAERVERLLEHGADATATTGPLELAPILYACLSRLGRTDAPRAAGIRASVRVLLDAGADPNAAFFENDWLQVPLYGAAGIANDAELTRMLIAAGADPNDAHEPFEVGEALYHACEFPDPTCARLLIEAGTAGDVVDYCVGRALNFANHEMVAMFCAAGAHASAAHLHQAAWRRRPAETVAALLDARAPADEPGEDGRTPLRVATRWGETDTVALLRERGADPAAITAEDRAIASALAGARVEVPTAPLDAMLDYAIAPGDLATVTALLDAGANPDGRPGDEHTPLGQASWRGHPEIVRELIGRGASLRWPQGTPIGSALDGSRNCQDPEGGPTMRTIEEIPKARYAAVVEVLLAAGAGVPERFGDDSVDVATALADLGIAAAA